MKSICKFVVFMGKYYTVIIIILQFDLTDFNRNICNDDLIIFNLSNWILFENREDIKK